MSTGIQGTVEQLQRRVLGSREERARAFVMGARLVDGTDLSLRFEPARPIEKVRVHVQSTATGEGGGDYSAVNFTSDEDVDCRGSKVQDYAVTLDPAERYFVWVIPLVQDGAGVWHQRLDEAEYLDVAPEGSALWEPLGTAEALIAALDLDSIPGTLDASKLYGAAVIDEVGANIATFGSVSADYGQIGGAGFSSASLDLSGMGGSATIIMPVGTPSMIPRLDADRLDGYHAAGLGRLDASATWALSQIFTAAASFQSATVPFVVVGTGRVDNLNPEKWDGLGRGTTGQVVLGVSAGASVYGQITDAHILGAAAIAWSKISKSGSSLADLGARSATDLTGTLPDARLSANVPLLNAAQQFSVAQRVNARVNIGSPTSGSVLIVGDQSLTGANALTSGVGQEIYADGNNTYTALLYSNRDTGTGAGLDMLWSLKASAGVSPEKRALAFRLQKSGTWDGTVANQNAGFIVRMIRDGTLTDTLFLTSKANLGLNGNSYGGGTGVVFVADRTVAPTGAPTGGFLMSGNAGVPTFRTSGNKIINLDQSAAITAPTGGAIVDAECRTAVGLIITALQARGFLA